MPPASLPKSGPRTPAAGSTRGASAAAAYAGASAAAARRTPSRRATNDWTAVVGLTSAARRVEATAPPLMPAALCLTL